MDQHENDKKQIPVENIGDQDKPLIFMLNYDCFMNIFAYLDLLDLYLVAQTCKCFGNLAYSQLKNHTTLDTSNIYHRRNLQLIDFNSVIKQFGHFLNTLVWECDLPGISLSQMIPLIPQYCLGNRHLAINGWRGSEILKETEIVTPLESLVLPNCSLTDTIGEPLKFSVNLRNINFSNSLTITGKCLINLMNLESLNLLECCNIEGKYLNQILKNNKNLKYLNVSGCIKLQADTFQNMSRHCEELIHLVMSNSFNMHSGNLDVVAKIPKLKNLSIFQYKFQPFLIDSLLLELACVNKLEFLKIDGNILTNSALYDLKRLTSLKTLKLYHTSSLDDIGLNLLSNNMDLEALHLRLCDKITNQGLLQFIINCTSLAYLSVRFCHQISRKFFFEAHLYLTSHKSLFSSRKTAKIKVYYNSQINESFKFDEGKKLLEEVFEFLKTSKMNPDEYIACLQKQHILW